MRHPTDPDPDSYLPGHVYANWLILAARIVVEIADTDPDERVTPAESEQERQAWQQWAKDHLRHIDSERRPPARGTAKAKRIGHMTDAEPDRSGARPGPTANRPELLSAAIRQRAGSL